MESPFGTILPRPPAEEVSSGGGSRQFVGFTFGRPMPPAEVSFGGGAAFGRPSFDEYLKERGGVE